MQLLLGCRAALGLRGVQRHRHLDGGRHRTALVAAVNLLLLAARAVPSSVEQHAVIAPRVAAPLALGQGLADQPAHRIFDRPGQPHSVLQAPGEALRRVHTAGKPDHPGQLATGRSLHQLSGGRTFQARPHQIDRSQGSP
ncbi:hypothetical protein ABZ371_05190 [Streptomyces sp. NPDC005899]|uniref:hypothetical protein n=1 Tax=Streptomyces sp. NPDC005899 TaxID=3155716 RepID=UPI0033FA1EF3